jgi:hypothetical protein
MLYHYDYAGLKGCEIRELMGLHIVLLAWEEKGLKKCLIILICRM